MEEGEREREGERKREREREQDDEAGASLSFGDFFFSDVRKKKLICVSVRTNKFKK